LLVIHFLELGNLKIFVVDYVHLVEIQCVDIPYLDAIH